MKIVPFQKKLGELHMYTTHVLQYGIRLMN